MEGSGAEAEEGVVVVFGGVAHVVGPSVAWVLVVETFHEVVAPCLGED